MKSINQSKKSRRVFLKKAGSAGLVMMLPPFNITPETKFQHCASNIQVLPSKKRFRLAIWGDPQVAYWTDGYSFKGYGSETPDARFRSISKKVNPKLAQGVELTNQCNPDFVIIVGDNVHGYGEHEHYGVFTDIVKGQHYGFSNEAIKSPLFTLGGNHDHWRRSYDINPKSPYKERYPAEASHTEYGNYLAFTREIGSPPYVNYSFDMGEWHFILFSQMAGGADGEFERHPEYFRWLEQDLQNNRTRPTVFCSHHPMVPQGSRHFDSYGPSSTYRRMFHDILKKHGNVKYAFFGHVHNTIYSIKRISWKYDGICYMTIPNISFSTRRHDFYEYPEFEDDTQGVLTIDFEGDQAGRFRFTTQNENVYTIRPKTLQVYDDETYGYLKPEWSWNPHSEGIKNGNFETPLKGSWYQSHYIDYFKEGIDKDASCPWYKREIKKDESKGFNYLYTYTRAWKSAKGASQLIIDIRQAVAHIDSPKLQLHYKVFGNQIHLPDYCRPFIILGGYKKQQPDPEWVLFYNIGATGGKLINKRFSGTAMQAFYRRCQHRKEIFIKRDIGHWILVKRDIASDFEEEFAMSWKDQLSDTIILTIGNYCSPRKENGVAAELGLGFSDIKWIEG